MVNKLHYLLLFVLIFCSFTSIRAAVPVQTPIRPLDGSYSPEYNFNNEINGFTYSDGTGLMQSFNDTDKNLYIRLLHPNGTLTNFTVPLELVYNNSTGAYPLNYGYVFVTQISDDKSALGTLVDWHGQVLQR